MDIPLLYGMRGTAVRLPHGVRPWIAVRGEEGRAQAPEIATALCHPVDSAPLSELAKSKQRACVVVSDNTRASPTPLLVSSVLDVIQDLVPEIRVLVATGLHAPLSRGDLSDLVGARAIAECSVSCHDARDAGKLVVLGTSPRGIPVLVSSVYVESDLRILTGLVEPHFMAGYSGGRKSVCPGIMGAESIQLFHSPRLLESDSADYGILAGNPVHEEALWIAQSVGVDFIVNVALNKHQQLAHVSAGHLVSAWMECVEFVSTHGQTQAPGLFDIVITSNGGYPLDRNYYQAVKGLVAAARIVRPGGIIILAAECCDGIGSDDFRRALADLIAFGDLDDYISHISVEANWTVDQWEVEMLTKALRRVSAIFLYAKGIRHEDLPLTCATPFGSLEEALLTARRRIGRDAAVAVMPEGPYLVPSAAGGANPPGAPRRGSTRSGSSRQQGG